MSDEHEHAWVPIPPQGTYEQCPCGTVRISATGQEVEIRDFATVTDDTPGD